MGKGGCKGGRYRDIRDMKECTSDARPPRYAMDIFDNFHLDHDADSGAYCCRDKIWFEGGSSAALESSGGAAADTEPTSSQMPKSEGKSIPSVALGTELLISSHERKASIQAYWKKK